MCATAPPFHSNGRPAAPDIVLSGGNKFLCEKFVRVVSKPQTRFGISACSGILQLFLNMKRLSKRGLSKDRSADPVIFIGLDGVLKWFLINNHHYAGCFDHCISFFAHRQPEPIHGIDRDDGDDFLTVGQFKRNFGIHHSIGYFCYFPLE
jgi:hypothetical protein